MTRNTVYSVRGQKLTCWCPADQNIQLFSISHKFPAPLNFTRHCLISSQAHHCGSFFFCPPCFSDEFLEELDILFSHFPHDGFRLVLFGDFNFWLRSWETRLSSSVSSSSFNLSLSHRALATSCTWSSPDTALLQNNSPPFWQLLLYSLFPPSTCSLTTYLTLRSTISDPPSLTPRLRPHLSSFHPSLSSTLSTFYPTNVLVLHSRREVFQLVTSSRPTACSLDLVPSPESPASEPLRGQELQTGFPSTFPILNSWTVLSTLPLVLYRYARRLD